MKRRIISLAIIFISLITIFFIISKVTTKPSKEKIIKEFDEYKDIDVNDIEEIQIRKYLEAGIDTDYVSSKDEIKSLYNELINIKVGEETDMACDDNTTIYTFLLKDSTTVKLIIECDWIIINNKRYMITK